MDNERAESRPNHEPWAHSMVTPVLNQTVAREIAAIFLDAPSDPDAVVDAAHRELQEQSDRSLCRVTRRHGIRIVFTRCSAPYASDREMIKAVREHHLLEVVTAANEPDRRHPIMECEPGGAYDRFRALHDVTGHVLPGFGFDREGEFGAWLMQERLYTGLARHALATELHAEHSVRWTTGDPSDHKATLLPRELVDRARRGDGPLLSSAT